MRDFPEGIEKEVFDPTGQGVEVVDAEVARNLFRQIEILEERLLEITDKAKGEVENERLMRRIGEEDAKDGWARAEALCKECVALRAIFTEILEALGDGGDCGPLTSVEFFQSIPGLVRRRLQSFPQEVDDEDEAIVLVQIRRELENFMEHPDCTIVDAVRLLKCQLADAESENVRSSIYEKWAK